MIDNETIKNIVEDNGVFLYDIELTEENDQKFFRIYITKKEGITLDDCSKITKIISPIIDINPPTNEHYFLEVSSPGINRSLKKPIHFINSIEYIAKLLKADDNKIVIEDKNKETIIPYSEISKANTYIKW